MNNEQLEFYNYWFKNWENGRAIDVSGQISYLFCYTYNVLNLNPKEAISELKKLCDAYNKEKSFYFICKSWISDFYLIVKEYRNALENFPPIPISARSSFLTNALLSLKLLVYEHISGKDILTLNGPKVTAWGKRNLEEISIYADVFLEAHEKEKSVNLILEWSKDSRQYQYSLFTG